MKKKVRKQKADELRLEYDFSKLKNGVRGKYAARVLSKTQSSRRKLNATSAHTRVLDSVYLAVSVKAA
jgi:hypothetical protein